MSSNVDLLILNHGSKIEYSMLNGFKRTVKMTKIKLCELNSFKNSIQSYNFFLGVI